MRRKRVISDINVVPYIDVMLVLLVIFMVTAPLLQQGVEVDLPDAEQSETIDIQADEEPVMLSVDRNGSMYLNIGGEPDTPLDGQTIVARVTAWRNINPQATVLIRGDGGADYKQVMDAMVLLQRAGVDTIGLVTESPATEP